MNWLAYSQSVLQKVHFDRSLFRKELGKLLQWLSHSERLQLLRWCRTLPRRRGNLTAILCLLTGISLSASAQTMPFSHDNGLILHASDVAVGHVAFGFTKGQQAGKLQRKVFPILTERWRLKTPDTSFTFGPKDAWGVRADGRTYRFWKNYAIELAYAGPICLYKFYSSRSTQYYFSRDLDSPLYQLTANELKRVYADQPGVLEGIRQLRWSQAPEDIVRETGTYRVLSWFAAPVRPTGQEVSSRTTLE